jgi:hypothetical protein
MGNILLSGKTVTSSQGLFLILQALPTRKNGKGDPPGIKKLYTQNQSWIMIKIKVSSVQKEINLMAMPNILTTLKILSPSIYQKSLFFKDSNKELC